MRSARFSSMSANVPAATVLFSRFRMVTEPSVSATWPGRPGAAAAASERWPAPRLASR